MDLGVIKEKVLNAIKKFYDKNYFLIKNNLSERCQVHRLAMHLEQENFPKGYFVDVEYNKAHINETTSNKIVSNIKGNYIDIIITKRNGNPQDDLVCFEVKKKKNRKGRDKDRKNLRILTKGIRFAYDIGFYIILGKDLEDTKIEVYEKGEKIEDINLK